MKNILISMFLGLFILSCATTTSPIRPNSYTHITAKAVNKNCQPVESYRVNTLGLSGFVVLFEGCLNTKKLLIIVVDLSAYTPEIRETSVSLLALHYVEFLKRSNVKTGEQKFSWKLTKIKEENSQGGNTHFYLLLETKSSCDDGVCVLPSK